MTALVCSVCGLAPERTQEGRLPPWEVAKAAAFSVVITHMADHLQQSPFELLGKRVDEFIAEHLTLVGGGQPTPRAVRQNGCQVQNR